MKQLRLAALPALCLLVTCDRGDRVTGPLASISDGSHLAGNRNFFFLPPLVPNPSGSPGYEPLAFDPAVRPTVEICRLEGTTCAAPQPDGFPLVYAMESGPGGQTVRLVESEQHFIANWHAADFQLDPASNYRITVLVRGAPLGYADVDVVSNGRELRNVNTNEFIALLDGRTLPIKFRVERGAVVAISLIEPLTVRDENAVLVPQEILVLERVQITDRAKETPPASVNIREPILVTDRVRLLPSITINVQEKIRVADNAGVVTN